MLAQARVVALFTIGETPWSAAQRSALLDGVRAGRTSVLAIHSATDSCHGWEEYRLLVGARFAGHPWTQEVTLDVLVPDHPAVAHLGATLALARRDLPVLRSPPGRPGLARRPFGRAGKGHRRHARACPYVRLSVVVVFQRGCRSSLLFLARPLSARLGDPRLPPTPGRWPRLAVGRGSAGLTRTSEPWPWLVQFSNWPNYRACTIIPFTTHRLQAAGSRGRRN